MITVEKTENLLLPLVSLSGDVLFPPMTASFEFLDESTVAAVNAAVKNDSYIFFVASKSCAEADDGSFENEEDSPRSAEFYDVGTVAKIKQAAQVPGGVRVLVEGVCRASLGEIKPLAEYSTADIICKKISAEDGDLPSTDMVASRLYVMTLLGKMISLGAPTTNELRSRAAGIKNFGLLADVIAANALVRFEDKQRILEEFDPKKRLDTLLEIMEEEIVILECEKGIQASVRERMNQNQREYYLREEMKVIQDELGMPDFSDADEYYEKITEAKLPSEVKEKLLKENGRLAKTPFGSAEAGVMRGYIETCLDIPWLEKSSVKTNIATAKKVLDADHDGLEKVKERILEFLAVKQLSPELKSQIICLVGPPGVGKTSVGASIAKALGRKYVRVSLGGVRDESDIRGHRKTYIGSMPGRIVNALIQAKVNNPLILLDEIDKLTSDAHGDPASALLEVLDGEQNKAFRDHFVELPIDLSDCLFIATANTLETVPRPLIDRMEIIELKTYSRTEKLMIAKHHLVRKQLERHGLTRKNFSITDAAICEIIDGYTREAGVRNLERSIASLCRKAAKKLIEDDSIKTVRISERNLEEFLGPRKILPDKISDENEIGTVNGLAYTEVGGDMLKIEVAVLDGSGNIELTGSLGDVMKESAKLAVSYVRSLSGGEYSFEKDFYKTKDIHIHCPEGAVPKDGPSAGVTMTTALVSALTGIPVKRDIAMTGEITLRGNVLPIGGLKEKTMAAYSAGVKTVFIPADNMRDLDDIAPEVKEALDFVPCKKISDVLDGALLR